MLRRALALALAPLVLGPLCFAPAARAADPIMPLAELRPGMDCTALSVLRGTTVSAFDAEILDVIAGEFGSGPLILVRLSGPAIADTGVGPGFSGSPIMCPDDAGTLANAGAIAQAVGEYGNDVALATPIEEMLRDEPAAVAGARRRPRLLRSALPLTGPLGVSGLSPRVREVFARAARRAGLTVLAAPSGPAGGFPQQELVPGSAVAAALSTGDLGLTATGTVTYRDGARIWAFGHPLDGLGRRALFLQDAYIYGIVSNPLGTPDAITYKLASGSGHVQGVFSSDSLSSIAGTLGAGPPAVPLDVVVWETGGGSLKLSSLLADERALGFGANVSLMAPLGAFQALQQVLRGAGPATLSLCFRVRVPGRRRPLGFCNPYFGADAAFDDLLLAGALVDGFDLVPLPIERVTVSARARRGIVSDVLISARAPRRVRHGERIRVRLTVQRRGGGRRTLRLRLRVPRGLRPGRRTLVLSGANGGDSFGIEEVLFEGLGFGEEETPTRSLRELEAQLDSIERELGIEARFRRDDGRLVYRSDSVRFEGRAEVSLRVVPKRR